MDPEPIAIIGMATRLPGPGGTIEGLWRFLLDKGQAMTGFPAGRLDAQGFYHEDFEHSGTFNCSGAHFLSEDPALFDAGFFGVRQGELPALDPQQRLVLESVYHALENAGLILEKLQGSKTSVFVTGCNHEHACLLAMDPEAPVKYKLTGATNSILANRVSWYFDFKGPSMAVDSSCSSTLAALHLAVQSLRSGESSIAVVSGVNVLWSPEAFCFLSDMGLLSDGGQCFSFDDRADGYARGEGVGTVILKPVSAALADGDTIRAAIRATGLNQDGRTPGITNPNAAAQESLIRDVYASAGLDLSETHYVEAHGTGTAVGDPTEVSAIANAFGAGQRDSPLLVGSIKSNIGHLEGGSGMAGLIKSVLILERGIIPPNANLRRVNPLLSHRNIQFPVENIPWPIGGRRRISLNNFGVGGTNAHCIVEDAGGYLIDHSTTPMNPSVRAISQQDRIGLKLPSGDAPPYIFRLSAFDEEGISRNASALATYLSEWTLKATGDEPAMLNNLQYTLSSGRSTFPHGAHCTARSIANLQEQLAAIEKLPRYVRSRKRPEIGFVFTGQGAQYHGMGRELFIYSSFRRSLEAADAYFKSLGSHWSLLEELLSDQDPSRIDSPGLAQAACSSIQIAIIELLGSWNIYPSRVIGHSSGEIAAAYCAGKISREGAWTAAYYRGLVVSESSDGDGAMLSVKLPLDQLTVRLKAIKERHPGELTIACFNSPTNHTVSGDRRLIDELGTVLDREQVAYRRLNVSNAYHSAHMESPAMLYKDQLGDTTVGSKFRSAGEIRMYSFVTGDEVAETSLMGQHWAETLRCPVQFATGLSNMCFEPSHRCHDAAHSLSVGVQYLIEIGTHSTLATVIRQTMEHRNPVTLPTYLNVLDRNRRGPEVLLSTVGVLACNGYDINIDQVNSSSDFTSGSGPPRLLLDLPPYHFNHSGPRVIHESRIIKSYRHRKFPRHDLIGSPSVDWNPLEPRWRHFLRLQENPWLREQTVGGKCVCPGAMYLAMSTEAARQKASTSNIGDIIAYGLRKVTMNRVLVVPDSHTGIEISLSMLPTSMDGDDEEAEWERVRIMSYDTDTTAWADHFRGEIRLERAAQDSKPCPDSSQASLELAQMKDRSSTCLTPVHLRELLTSLEASGVAFGPLYGDDIHCTMSGQSLGRASATVSIPEVSVSQPRQHQQPYIIHPVTLERMMHILQVALYDAVGEACLTQAALLTGIDNVRVSANIPSRAGSTFHVCAEVVPRTRKQFTGHLTVYDGESGRAIIEMSGISLMMLDRNCKTLKGTKMCHTLVWKPDLGLLDQRGFRELCTGSSILGDRDRESELKYVGLLQLAAGLLMQDAWNELVRETPAGGWDSHLRCYADWMRHHLGQIHAGLAMYLPLDTFQEFAGDPLKTQSVYDKASQRSLEGAYTVHVGRNIARVFQGQVSPLELPREFGHFRELYDELLHRGELKSQLRTYLDLLKHSHSGLRIIEIGAGMGTSTAVILDALLPSSTQPGSGSNASPGVVSQYVFTDVSSAFFGDAQERFQKWKDILTYQRLNIEQDPATQGFEVGGFDVVVAGNVIHATTDLVASLTHCRALLKPGGKLILCEGSRPELLWTSMSFGLFEGWWTGTDSLRKWCPLLSPEQWEPLLRLAGFAGIELRMADSLHADLARIHVLVTSPVVLPPPSAIQAEDPGHNLLILCRDGMQSQALGEDLKAQLTNLVEDLSCSIVDISNLEQLLDGACQVTCLVVLEHTEPFIHGMSTQNYELIRQLLLRCPRILWVTGNPSERPKFGLISGLLRTVRWERDADDVNFSTLALTPGTSSPNSRGDAELIANVYRRLFRSASCGEGNQEYMFRDGFVQSLRLASSEWSLGSSQGSFTPHIDSPPVAHWLDERDPPWQCQTVAPEVVVRLTAVGLSSRHRFDSNKPRSDIPFGYEAAGVVTAINPKTTKLKLKTGDRVMFLLKSHISCFAPVVKLPESHLVRLPDAVPFSVSVSEIWDSAIVLYSLRDRARLEGDESVLIQYTPGGVAGAAIRYALRLGARTFVVVSSPADRALVMQLFDLPEAHILNMNESRASVETVRRLTAGNGVDVIFTDNPGKRAFQLPHTLSPGGRCVSVTYDGDPNQLRPGDFQNCSLISVNPFLLLQARPDGLLASAKEVSQQHADGKISDLGPCQYMKMKLSQIEEGCMLLTGKDAPRKIVFEADTDSPRPLFQPDASYILAGGLGGIGRRLTGWMVSCGARHLILLSRRGDRSPGAPEVIKGLQLKGCTVETVACDISNKEELSSAINHCKERLPPIKGCIQASMVIKDRLYANLSHAEWRASISPKVQGSWNLHEILPRGLDFFVLLSSATGIVGNRGQANYNAGNTYQDALARYRVSLGEKAFSLDLGVVSDIGFAAEHRENTKHLDGVLGSLQDREIFALLRYAIDTGAQLTGDTCQLVTGIRSEDYYHAQGLPPPSYLRFPLFGGIRGGQVRARENEDNPIPAESVSLLSALRQVTTVDEATEVTTRYLSSKLASLLAVPAGTIDLARPISFLGVDSLVALDLRSALATELKMDVGMADVLSDQTIGALARTIALRAADTGAWSPQQGGSTL